MNPFDAAVEWAGTLTHLAWAIGLLLAAFWGLAIRGMKHDGWLSRAATVIGGLVITGFFAGMLLLCYALYGDMSPGPPAHIAPPDGWWMTYHNGVKSCR